MSFYKNLNVTVTGGTGLIGRPLVEKLLQEGAKLRIVSLDDPSRAPKDAEFMSLDLRNFDNCLKAVQGQDIVFNVIGVKGSPKMTKEQPASFFVPTISFSVNMMEAARQAKVGRYLFTSSVGVYQPADIFYEDDVWKTFPSPNDRFAGWAKRMGELQAEAYQIQYGWDNISIVRPANVYGPWDNFDPNNAMVIPSLIMRALSGERPLTIWGDGTPIRDFIYAEDVAIGMMMAVEKGYNKPVNLGSGTGVSIKELATIIAELMDDDCPIQWDTSKPSGDKLRLMDATRAQNELGFTPKTSLRDGVAQTIAWYKEYGAQSDKRYNSFTEEI